MGEEEKRKRRCPEDNKAEVHIPRVPIYYLGRYGRYRRLSGALPEIVLPESLTKRIRWGVDKLYAGIERARGTIFFQKPK